MRNVIWWFTFMIAAIWGQLMLPGVDLLVVGLILSLQEERLQQTAWLAVAFMLIQEGSGSLAFGSSVLWYALVVVFYTLGRWLFDPRGVQFVCLLGLVMGVWHYLLAQMMATLQEYTVQVGPLAEESVLQALIIPLAWLAFGRLRGKKVTDALAY